MTRKSYPDGRAHRPSGGLRHPSERLIVALDVPTDGEALSLVDLLLPDVKFFKVGLELFVASGPSVVSGVRERGGRVFLDLKLHDIPNTVKRAVSCATRLGAAIISLHLSAGRECLESAAEGIEEGSSRTSERPLLAGVTVLTSLGSEQAGDTAGSVLEQVLRLSRLAKECGIGGIITSVREAADVRRALGGECVIITPGIRLRGPQDDHKRAGTVRDALLAGSDYLVVGRPITRASNPLEEAKRFLNEIAAFDSID
ncbi:MAG: orotidine-5'-phosphate decarboxylase [Candidatus Eisenbacteria bacterium]|nr:orotidine-5'-phosphate decarboxylase [Candidatus Eisenbacteria bacterium]